jgi:hypothetical protein
MDFSKEEINQYRKGPKEDIVNPICHGVQLLVLGFVRHMLVDFWFLRHLDRHTSGLRALDKRRCVLMKRRPAGNVGAASLGQEL